jgi:hypothetical protein
MPHHRLRFVVLLLAALTLTMEAAHVLELPQKLSYSIDFYTAVNSTMYRYFALVGGPLTLLTLLTGAALVVVLRGHAGFRWTLAGVAAYYLAFAVWLVVVAREQQGREGGGGFVVAARALDDAARAMGGRSRRGLRAGARRVRVPVILRSWTVARSRDRSSRLTRPARWIGP